MKDKIHKTANIQSVNPWFGTDFVHSFISYKPVWNLICPCKGKLYLTANKGKNWSETE